jgi:serine/threonine protein phosphatase PrpC
MPRWHTVGLIFLLSLLTVAMAARLAQSWWIRRRRKPRARDVLQLVSIDVHAEQNKREYMEDAHGAWNGERFTVLAVMDGHGGADAATICKNVLDTRVQALMEGAEPPAAWLPAVFETCHARVLERTSAGTTMVVVVVDRSARTIYTAWVGDSFAFCTDAKSMEMILTHTLHVPTHPVEQRWILDHGGTVRDGRVNGVLAMSRAIGDARLAAVLRHDPDITFTDPMEEPDLYVVLVTDGMTDCFRTDEMIQAIRAGASARDIMASRQRALVDNTTMLIARFRQ